MIVRGVSECHGAKAYPPKSACTRSLRLVQDDARRTFTSLAMLVGTSVVGLKFWFSAGAGCSDDGYGASRPTRLSVRGRFPNTVSHKGEWPPVGLHGQRRYFTQAIGRCRHANFSALGSCNFPYFFYAEISGAREQTIMASRAVQQHFVGSAC